jgi:hypothetical protein
MSRLPPRTCVVRLVEHIAQFQWRVLQDALTEATAAYWERRADTFDWVAGDPTEPDPHGIKNHARATARSCRHYAELLRESGLDAETRDLITAVLSTRDGHAA